MWDLWWKKRHRVTFSPISSANHSTVIIIIIIIWSWYDRPVMASAIVDSAGLELLHVTP
jgi:hypothetical protein